MPASMIMPVVGVRWKGDRKQERHRDEGAKPRRRAEQRSDRDADRAIEQVDQRQRMHQPEFGIAGDA